jgi:hypothetical protein
VEALTDDDPVADDDGADERVRADPPAAALRELEGTREVCPVGGCQLGVHNLIDLSINFILAGLRRGLWIP